MVVFIFRDEIAAARFIYPCDRLKNRASAVIAKLLVFTIMKTPISFAQIRGDGICRANELFTNSIPLEKTPSCHDTPNHLTDFQRNLIYLQVLQFLAIFHIALKRK